MSSISYLLILCSFFSLSCGKTSETHIKDYRIFVNSADEDLVRQVNALVSRFNRESGTDSLSIVADKVDANSYVSFRQGILSKEGKLGYGQWNTLTTESGGTHLTGSNEVTVEYGMSLEFDLEYFKAGMVADRSQTLAKDLYLLWCHEVGHGLKMAHSKDHKNVMYHSIDSKRLPKFTQFYNHVRNFLGY